MLNKDQNKAVRYNKGPLLIIAGAGTGKTMVIVEKIKYLIKKKLANVDQILALAFTEKAANEMVERVDQELPYGYSNINISTFHGFADEVLKNHIHQIGLSTSFKLMTEAEAILFIKKNLFLFDLDYYRPLGNPNNFIEDLLKHFSRLKDENVSPDQYLKWVKSQKSKIPTSPRLRGASKSQKIEIKKYFELARAYKKYQELKIKGDFFDFSDLVYYTLELFKKRKNILKEYQKKFKYVLVDEFQDTNICQYELIKLICPSKIKPKLTVVGDDSQAIYKFRGASVSNILNFINDYPATKKVNLIINYRSSQPILDASHQLIKFNNPDTLESKMGISKKLIGKKSDVDQPINFIIKNNGEDEADFIAKEIIKLKSKYNLNYQDFAILLRANNHSEPIIRSFYRQAIPYQFFGQSQLLKQPEVKDLIAYLKVLDNLEDSISFYRVLEMEIFSIDSKDIALLLSFSKKINVPLFQAIEIYFSSLGEKLSDNDFSINTQYLPLLKKDSKNKLLNIYQMIIRHLSLIKKNSAGQILYYFLENTKYLNRLITYKSETEEKIALNISKFFSRLKDYESTHEDYSIHSVVDFLEMSMELGESPISPETDKTSYDAVNILTVHSAKGLEFEVVFLSCLTQTRFPTKERKEKIPIPISLIKEILPIGDPHIQEERRLFYVGLTRAKKIVILTTSKFYSGGKRMQKISQFVYETLKEKYIKNLDLINIEEKKQLSIFDFKTPESISIKNQIKINNFSYSQLESFERCPLQYKYQFILKLPSFPSSALSFGTTIHNTLLQFYQLYRKDNKTDTDLLFFLYKKNWLPLGYSSVSHQERIKKEGLIILKNYIKIFFRPTIIIDLEKKFKIKITKDIFLTGKIDRIDKNNARQIEIIDYKTGKVPDEKKLKNDIQLSIYALAASSRELFRKNLKDIKTSYYFLNTGEKKSYIKTEKEINETKEKIIKTVSEIRKNDFSPKPGPQCDFCSFKIICEAWQ